MLGIDDGLGVEALMERPIRGFHDLGLGVSEITLRLRFRDRLRTRGRDTFGNRVVVLTTLTTLGAAVSLGTLAGLVLECLFGFTQFHQPRLATP